MSDEDPIFQGFLRGVPGSDENRTPAEKFADPKAVATSPALQFDPDNEAGKVFLGVTGATIATERDKTGRILRHAVGGVPIGIADDRHHGIIAGNRSGKGRGALVPTLATYPGSCLVIDPKSDLFLFTAKQRRKMGHVVYNIDPFGASGQPSSDQFNPMDILQESDDQLADAGLIGDALFVATPGEKDPHWNDTARQFIEGLILHVATAPGFKGKRNLVEVYKLLWRVNVPAEDDDAGDERKGGRRRFALENEMLANLAAGGAVMHAARDLYEKADRERDSVVSTARRHLHFLGYPKIQRTLTASSFDLRDLKRKKMTVYLSLPAMRMATCSRLLRLFVNLTLAAVEQERTRPEHPVLLMLDEFAVLGPMAAVENAAGQIAGLGCRLMFVLQDLAQLKALYAERWETFLGNAGVLQFFGNSDLTTLDWIAKRLGTTAVTNTSQSSIAYDAAAKGTSGQSWSSGTAELMTAAEIARHFGRDDAQLRQLIIRPGVPPIVLQRAFYDKHELFRGRFTPESETGRR